MVCSARNLPILHHGDAHAKEVHAIGVLVADVQELVQKCCHSNNFKNSTLDKTAMQRLQIAKLVQYMSASPCHIASPGTKQTVLRVAFVVRSNVSQLLIPTLLVLHAKGN